MAKSKATITLDRDKAEKASALVGSRSISEVIDVALGRLIKVEQLRRDIAAYIKKPPTDGEIALGHLPIKFDLDDDDVDYEALLESGE